MTFAEAWKVRNHRGVPTPRTLGLMLAAGGLASVLALESVTDLSPEGLATAVSFLAVFTVGVLDDLATGGPRGLRGHLRALGEGHVTTGVLKAAVIVACSVFTATVLPLGTVAVLAGVPLLAGAANLANALDVRPGRALKVFLPILLVGAVVVRTSLYPALPGLAVAALVALRPDLRERAMLGDGGANLLGFAGGLVLLVALPQALVPLLAVIVVGLNVLAETVGLSTLIARSRRLTFVDRWGRLPEP